MLTALRTIARKLLDVLTTVAETVVEIVADTLKNPLALGFVGALTGAFFLFSR